MVSLLRKLSATVPDFSEKSCTVAESLRLICNWPRWRYVKCREQLAACYSWSGNQKKAERLFSAFLDEIEALELDEFRSHDAVVNLDELVDTLTRKLDNAWLLQRTRVQARRFGFEKRYENLFSIHR
jgi:hypothetical protein